MSKPLISFAVIILSLGFGFFYVKPAYDRVGEHRTAITDLDGTLKRAQEIETLIGETEKELASVDAGDRARFAVFLPETMDPIRFANTIQRIGTTRGLVLESIKVAESNVASANVTNGQTSRAGVVENTLSLNRMPQQGVASAGAVTPTSSKSYKTTTASFLVATSYGTFLKFLDDLEKSLGLINVTSLSFAPVTDTAGAEGKKSTTPMYQYAVDIETYSLK